MSCPNRGWTLLLTSTSLSIRLIINLWERENVTCYSKLTLYTHVTKFDLFIQNILNKIIHAHYSAILYRKLTKFIHYLYYHYFLDTKFHWRPVQNDDQLKDWSEVFYRKRSNDYSNSPLHLRRWGLTSGRA